MSIELTALLHHKLVHIHPFFDGNGRTARLLMNLLLMLNCFTLTIILKNDRKKFFCCSILSCLKNLNFPDNNLIVYFINYQYNTINRLAYLC